MLMGLFLALSPVFAQGELRIGAERIDVITRLLEGKRVGLVVNQTSIIEKTHTHLLDTLLSIGIDVRKVFAPEHGFRGTADAGQEIKDSRDVKTGVPIISIYGKNKKPSADQLADLDILVFDIQDVGARFYTYISTWKHGDPYWLPVKPSPNLPNDQSIRLYPSLCFFEGTNISVGRGTYYPFQMLGAPDKRYGEFSFTPQSLPGFDTNPLHKDKTCYGVDLREYPFEGGLSLRFLLDFYEKADDKQAFFFSRPQWFDLLAGTKELRFQIIRGLSEEEIRASWQPGLEQYKAKRKKYLLYPDYGK